MLLRPIHPQPLIGNLKFLGRIPKTHEAQQPNQDSDCRRRNLGHSADIDSLGVIPEPVPEIHPLDQLCRPIRTFQKHELLERVFDISVSEVMAFNFGYAGDVSSTEGMLMR